jgi:SSS family solute:Na+ symporter
MVLSAQHIAGIVFAVLLVTTVGLYAGRKVKSAEDFSTSRRKASSPLVAGTLMGTMVGTASTIGTAQLAFRFGFCAWWWTLGAGIGFAILALGFARPLYESSVETLPQYLIKTYGSGIGPIASIFTSIGIYFNVIAGALAFAALFNSALHIGPMAAAALGLVLVLAYVALGGVWATGMAGVVKLFLLYVSMIACGVTAYLKVGGASGLSAQLPSFPWFSLFGRGFGTDFAAGFSMLLGVLSTQTYFQAIGSGRSFEAARTGAWISAIMTPPVGLGGIMVGLYMRTAFPKTPSSEVLPIFILKFLPPVLAGIVLATLLIAIVGSTAGLILGISTMFTKDIYRRYFRPQAQSKEALLVQRLAILIACAIPLLFVSGNAESLIIGWSFMSQGLRGCTVLFPLLGAMFFPRWLSSKAGVMAALLGPLANFVWHLVFPKGMDPLYPGLLASFLALVFVSLITKKDIHAKAIAAMTSNN